MSKKVKCVLKAEFVKVDDFLLNNFSSPTHWKEWNLIVSKHFNTEFFYYAYFEDDILTGVCPVHKLKRKYNFRLISGPKEFLIPYGGWIFNNTVEVKPNFIELQKNESLEIFSLPLINDFNAKYKDVNILKNYETAIIDLNQSEDDIWNGLNQKRRNMIRKAIKSDVTISLYSKENIMEFYDFYESANKQYYLQSLPVEYFTDLVKMTENINVDILVAKIGNESLGYNVIVSDKNYSIYWLGIRMKDSINNGFFDLLQWESIKKAKERYCRYYDFCYVEKDRLPNIYKFKTDYSKNKYGVLNIIEKSLVYSIINKIQKII
ncbi:MAG: peptidoglycan bridge formation glycyltransferase FemA/FemB family protein [Ignavibacteriae bacterium]|nr:peptidoglycan bridge formation glycyltransferase FemA/FemB family protein [Ignavibacteriota bacterium]